MKILITAGATWIKIDAIRILTSIFTGKTGLYLAKEFSKKGHSVTLIINPHCLDKIRGLRVIPFKYFEDFKKRLVKELKKNRYEAIIHSAAVSDYELKKAFSGKISSGKKELTLQLVPTEKIIKLIRKLAPRSCLIQFKLETNKKGLIKKAYRSLKENRSDFVVANALEDLRLGYRASLIDKNRRVTPIASRKALCGVLHKTIIPIDR